MKDMVCIVCPVGCRISVDEDSDYEVLEINVQRVQVMVKKN